MTRLAAAPFVPLDEHLAIDLQGARAVFTTRRGGVSSGPFESLNLGLRTQDERANVIANRAEVGLRDLLPIEPTCVNGQPIPPDIRDIFWEGACVIAASQR